MNKKVLNKQEIKNLITEKLPILVDFDSTMVITDKYPNIVGENKPCVDVMKKWIDGGVGIILWTVRDGKELDDAVEWCKEFNLVFDAINDNLPEIKEMYGNNSRKISCDIYIDDRSCIPEWE